MATIIQIKRSQSTNVPTGLANGEFAYSFSNDKLFIGQTDTATSAVTNDIVGGRYFTNMLDHAHGTLTGNSAIVVDTNSHVDNIITGGLKLTSSGGTANAVTEIQNDSSMGSASATKLATSASIKNYVDAQLGAVSSTIALAGDTGTDNYSTGDTLTFSGGTGLDSAITDDTVTFNITAGGVDTTQLADASVTGAKLAAATIAANAIATDAITTAKIDDGAVTGAKLAAGTIAANAIASDAVTTAKLDDGAVTAAKVANEGLGANTLASGAVTFAKLAAAAVVTESEGIGSNDNDTTIPTSAAVQDLVDNYLTVANAGISVTDGSTSTTIDGDGGTLTFSGTSNEVTVSESSGTITIGLPDDVTIAGELNVSENAVISGNLVVDGTLSYLNTTNLAVQDPLIKLANNNTTDSVDIGFYGKYSTTKVAGLFRDASDSGKFKLFNELTVDPTTTVNTGGSGYAAATLVLGSLELGTDLAVTHGGTGASTFTSKGILYGNGTSALQVTAAGSEGKVLQAGSGGTPEFGDLDGGTF